MGPNFKQLRATTFTTSTFKYINPLLGCEADEKIAVQDFPTLRTNLNKTIDDLKKTHQADSISVYFDNRNGRWSGFNTSEQYSPASMLKVPQLIATLKEAEENPAILNKKITYDGTIDLNNEQNFKPKVVLEAHKTYSVNELLERLIKYSDNNAAYLLTKTLDQTKIEQTFQDLGINLPKTTAAATGDFITIKDYASFFRILYNATYLNRDSSEKALGLLTQSDFVQGIKAGVPANIMVAQKFGERNFITPNGQSTTKELHNCGIVYYPEHPYILCIMTKGTDFNSLTNVIKQISQTTYQTMDEFVKNQNK